MKTIVVLFLSYASVFAADTNDVRESEKIPITIFHGTESEVLYLSTTNAAFSSSQEKTSDFLMSAFPHEEAAVTNGAVVLQLIQQQTSRASQRIEGYIGKRVAFYGGPAPSGNADLLIAKDVLLKIDIVPPKDVRPHAIL
ncbi:MAG TPA: hypothetical protein VL171_07910 [Verrucomicrobiae bacterium]|nr:hypothetical protein [Verrucomicrobiae bacterium]